jgi:HlyD family secretion protein
VDEGDTITAGQVLGEIDKAPYENALLQAKANVSTAKAKYDLVTAGYRDEEISQAAAAVNQAQAAYDYAQNFYQRQQGLWKSRTISANDLENARSSRDQAYATLKSAQDKLSQYRTGNRPQEIAQAKPASNRRRRNWRNQRWICRIRNWFRPLTVPCLPAPWSRVAC